VGVPRPASRVPLRECGRLLLRAPSTAGQQAFTTDREVTTLSGFLSNLWDFVWMFFTIFVFFAWLMALFSIIGDLFRDRALSGWAKAVWLLLLIFVPFLTALVYLIARGGGMAERAASQAKAQQNVTDDYIRSVAGAGPAQELTQAKALLDSGALSADEYAALKAKILS